MHERETHQNSPKQNGAQSNSSSAFGGAAATGTQTLLPAPAQQQLPVPMQGPLAPEQTAAAFNLAAVLDALRRRWFLALILGLIVGMGAAYGAWILIPAPFATFSEIRVEAYVPHPPGGGSGGPDFKTFKQTQMQLVKSPYVLKAALRDEQVSQSRLIQKVEERGEDPVRWLEENLNVSGRGTEFFRISLNGEHPSEVAAIVNAVTDAYKLEVVDKERIRVNQRLNLFNDLLADAQDKLDIQRRNLRDIAENSAANNSQLTEKQKHLLETRLALHQQLAQVKFDIMNLNILLDFQKKQANQQQDTPIDKSIIDAHIAGDPEFVKLTGRLDRLDSLLRWQKKNLSQNHPQIEKTKTQIAQMEKDLDALREKMAPEVQRRLVEGMNAQQNASQSQNETRLKFLQAKKEALQEEIDGIQVKQSNLGVSGLAMEDQAKEVERQEMFVKALANVVTRMNAELRLRDEEPRVKIYRKAAVPQKPSRKKKYMGTAMAGMGGFGLVLFGLVFLDIRARKISSVQQVTAGVGLPVVGSVPLMPRNAKARSNGRWSNRARYWHGVLTEAIDAARTLLMREAKLNSMNVFMVASAIGGEGKTTVVSHLATSLARAGKHVLLIDGDMRRPFIHRTFDAALEPGLAEVLRGEIELEEALQPSGIARLPILSAGLLNQKTLELLAQGRLRELLDEWATKFDFILFDTSPILPVTDSLLIAQHVDGVLFTVRRDVSRISKVMAASHRLSMLGVPVLGAMAVGLDDGVYGHRYPYRYGYQSYAGSMGSDAETDSAA